VRDVVIYLLYRSPSGGPESISGVAGVLRRAERNCVLIGDFNVPDVDWENGTASARTRELLEAAQDRLLE
jgi:hypothetical protein